MGINLVQVAGISLEVLGDLSPSALVELFERSLYLNVFEPDVAKRRKKISVLSGTTAREDFAPISKDELRDQFRRRTIAQTNKHPNVLLGIVQTGSFVDDWKRPDDRSDADGIGIVAVRASNIEAMIRAGYQEGLDLRVNMTFVDLPTYQAHLTEIIGRNQNIASPFRHVQRPFGDKTDLPYTHYGSRLFGSQLLKSPIPGLINALPSAFPEIPGGGFPPDPDTWLQMLSLGYTPPDLFQMIQAKVLGS